MQFVPSAAIRTIILIVSVQLVYVWQHHQSKGREWNKNCIVTREGDQYSDTNNNQTLRNIHMARLCVRASNYW